MTSPQDSTGGTGMTVSKAIDAVLLDDVAQVVRDYRHGRLTAHELLQQHFVQAHKRLADWLPEEGAIQ